MSKPPPQRPVAPEPSQTRGNQTHFVRSHVERTHITLKRIRFGNQELTVFPNSNISFKTLQHISLSKEQKCIFDNLWIFYYRNPKDQKHFLAVLNSLLEYFNSKRTTFKFYVFFNGKIRSVFHTWLEVLDSINNFPDPKYKGFNSISEAFDAGRSQIGLNCCISPSLKTIRDEPLNYSCLRQIHWQSYIL